MIIKNSVFTLFTRFALFSQLVLLTLTSCSWISGDQAGVTTTDDDNLAGVTTTADIAGSFTLVNGGMQAAKVYVFDPSNPQVALDSAESTDGSFAFTAKINSKLEQVLLFVDADTLGTAQLVPVQVSGDSYSVQSDLVAESFHEITLVVDAALDISNISFLNKNAKWSGDTAFIPYLYSSANLYMALERTVNGALDTVYIEAPQIRALDGATLNEAILNDLNGQSSFEVSKATTAKVSLEWNVDGLQSLCANEKANISAQGATLMINTKGELAGPCVEGIGHSFRYALPQTPALDGLVMEFSAKVSAHSDHKLYVFFYDADTNYNAGLAWSDASIYGLTGTVRVGALLSPIKVPLETIPYQNAQ
jgi:hypothetical protein